MNKKNQINELLDARIDLVARLASLDDQILQLNSPVSDTKSSKKCSVCKNWKLFKGDKLVGDFTSLSEISRLLGKNYMTVWHYKKSKSKDGYRLVEINEKTDN